MMGSAGQRLGAIGCDVGDEGWYLVDAEAIEPQFGEAEDEMHGGLELGLGGLGREAVHLRAKAGPRDELEVE